MEKSVKSRKINLDLSPDKRWIDILEEFKPELLVAKDRMKIIIDKMLGSSYYLIVPMIKSFKLFKSIMFLDELQSIADAMEMSFEYVLILQLCYEISSCCTSAITKIKDDYVFFRTMDWPMDFLKDLTVNLEFMKDGKTIFTTTTWVGYVGVLTVTVPEKYSIAVNYRRTNDVSLSSISKNVISIMNMNWPIGYLIRDVCEKNLSYKNMLHYMCKAKLVSPCYITICGTIERPKVITRDPDGYKIYKHTYVVQTNCDQNKVTPDILHSVSRRNKIIKSIEDNKNNFKDVNTLIKEFYIDPIRNDETIYYTIMIPKMGLHDAFLS
jgi:hypothetical protein